MSDGSVDLTMGLVTSDSTSREVLSEMLDHQGVTYEVIPEMVRHKYPVVLVRGHSEREYETARQASQNEQGIVDADQAADIAMVASRLQGKSTSRDCFEPYVNDEEEKLLSAIREAFFTAGLPLVRKWYWPSLAPACCVLTHDVDWFEYSPFHKRALAQSLNPARVSRLGYERLVKGRDFGWNVPETVELEKSHGFKSTFLFQTSYGRADLYLERSAKMLREESFEIALHGAGNSHKDKNALHEETRALRKKTGVEPRGIRYHILKFDVPGTWEIEASAGILYDATFCFNRFFGFRAEICFPYHPITDSRLPIVELPTCFMDWTSLHRNQNEKEQQKVLNRELETVLQYHGALVVNFHNTYLNEMTFPTVFRTYRSLLTTVSARGLWVATAEECVRWWTLRADTQIRPRLEGKDVRYDRSNIDIVVEIEGKEMLVVPAAGKTSNAAE